MIIYRCIIINDFNIFLNLHIFLFLFNNQAIVSLLFMIVPHCDIPYIRDYILVILLVLLYNIIYCIIIINHQYLLIGILCATAHTFEFTPILNRLDIFTINNIVLFI